MMSEALALGTKEEMHHGFWWIIPLVTLEFCGAVYLVYRWTFKGRNLHFGVHPLQTCGTVFDQTPHVDALETHGGGVPLRRKALAAWRTLVFLYMVQNEVRDFMEHGTKPLFYFTCWNYLLQVVFWGCVSCACLLHVCGYAAPEWLLRTSNFLHAMCLPMCILVSIVFWGALAPNTLKHGTQEEKDELFNIYNISEHAINTICMLIDFSVNRFLVHEHHLLPIMVWSCVYSGFTWIQHTVTKEWPYFFFAIKPEALLWYTGILLLHVALFKLAHALSRLKKRFVGEVDLIYAGEDERQEPLLQHTI